MRLKPLKSQPQKKTQTARTELDKNNFTYNEGYLAKTDISKEGYLAKADTSKEGYLADFEEEDSSGDGVSDEESIDGKVENTNFVEMGLLKKSLKLSLNHQVSKDN